jgi:Lipid A 3-O-deacylase (PagL)
MMPRLAVAALLLLAIGGLPRPARAFDSNETFAKGAFVLSVEGGGGEQHNIEDQRFQTGLEFWNAGVRFGWLPFGASFSGPLRGALEIGAEPFYQNYVSPVHAFYAGFGVNLRYHFLAFGRVVPWVELFGSAGGTDLKAREIDSTFTFLVHGGIGLSYFVTDRAAIYAGFREQHVSNGNTDQPNRGFESPGGVLGVSVVFP